MPLLKGLFVLNINFLILVHVICLHLIIMFKIFTDVVRYLYYFTKSHGSMATVLVNYTIQIIF